MALRGYELLLFVRAQNQASATLRRVANDVNNLKRVTKQGVPVFTGGERLQQQGRLIAHAGRTAQLAGLAAGAGLGVAAKAAADFNSSVTLAASQARDLDAPLAQIVGRTNEIEGQIKDLMGTFPAASDEMAASAYEIYSGINLFNGSLVDMERGLYSMNLANKAAVAGQADLADSTSLLITLANNFGDSEADMAKNMDTAFDIIRFGRLRMADLNDMMNKIAPAARGAGLELQDLAGATAYLTTVIPSQRQVATGMARLIDLLRHPDIVKGLQQFGVEVKDATGATRPFMEIMDELLSRFPELKSGEVDAANFLRTISQAGRLARTGRPGVGLTFTIEGRRVLTQLIQGWEQVRERQNQIIRNNGELETSYEALSESSGVRMRKFFNNLKRQFLDIGAAVIPVFEEIGGHAARLSRWWDTLDKQQRDNIVRWGAYAAILLVVGGALSAVIGGLTAMAGTLGILFRVGGMSAGSLGKLVGVASLLFGAKGINPKTIGMLSRFVSLLKLFSRFAKIGAVSLIIKAALTGDPTAIQLLQGALMGAAAGASFGPYGALAGAIIVPVAMRIAPMLNKPAKSAFDQLILNQFRKDFEGAVARGGDAIRDSWTKTLSQLHLYNIFVNSTADDFAAMALKAREAGKLTGNEYTAALKIALAEGMIDLPTFNIRMAEQIHDRPDITTRGVKEVSKVRETGMNKDLTAASKYFDALNKMDNEARDNAKRNAQQISDARRAAVEELSSFLIQQYQQIEDQNKQFMGSLFQGDWLTGESARLSEEWGIKPMAKDLLKDMRMQLSEFNKFNSTIAAIAKRGGPPALIEELKAMGPEGMQMLEALRKATPKEFNAIVAAYKQRQNAIRKQTQIDFNKQLAQWKKHGGNMMKAIISGLSAEHAQLEQYFQNMVGVWFPGFISQAVADARSDIAASADPKKKPVMPEGLKSGRVTRNAKGQLVYHEGNIAITVVQQPGETVEQAAKRAAMLARQGARTKAANTKKNNKKRNQVAEDWGIGRSHNPTVKQPPKGTGLR